MPWKCFLPLPSEFFRRSLRRYNGNLKCPHPAQQWAPGVRPWMGGYHDAEVVIDSEFAAPPEEEGGTLGREFADDPRWPGRCVCGYEFKPEDHWQANTTRLYRGSPDGKLYVLREFPPGAMWDAPWLEDYGRGPDGKNWCVQMPCGEEWIAYGPSSNGGKWVVQGSPPNITVSPSIHLVGRYHGFLKGGIVSEDCEGKKFPGVSRTA